MKLALCLLCLSVIASSANEVRAEPAPLQVTAKVIEMPKRIIACGVIAFRAVVRYQVISVDKGKTAAKELLVVELCPENLNVGRVRKLRLWPATKRDSFVDDFKSLPGVRWIHRPAES